MATLSNTVLDSDSDDELPPGWEERVTTEGKVYYANHENQNTQWKHPITGKKKVVRGELPYGWERKIATDGTVFYVDHNNQKTTYTDPRLAFAEELKDSPLDFRQKFDGSSTALQVLMGRDLTGKYCLITGANVGIGFETARSLALHGANVVLACRNVKAANEAKEQIIKEHSKAKVEVLHLDLASLDSVRTMADEYISKDWPLHLLILNAGVFGLSYSQTNDGVETSFQTNHLSHFYLTKLLVKVLMRSAPAKIVVLSSESHRFSQLTESNISMETLSPSQNQYSSLKAYNDQKLCNILFSSELNMRLSPHGVTSNAVHPGNMISTNIARNWWLSRLLFVVVRPFTKSVQQGAATVIYTAVAEELNGVGGLYFNNCCRCPPSAVSNNSQMSSKLWTLSEQFLKDILKDGAESPMS